MHRFLRHGVVALHNTVLSQSRHQTGYVSTLVLQRLDYCNAVLVIQLRTPFNVLKIECCSRVGTRLGSAVTSHQHFKNYCLLIQ